MDRPRPWSLNEQGITLAEILVAVAIIGIGLVGVASVFPLTSYGVYEGRALSTAVFLADERLEEIRNATWSTYSNATCSGTGTVLCDCLGTGPSAEPTSLFCTRTLPTACSNGASCTTYPDESSVTGYPGYSRTVRITDCGVTACAGVTNGDMRLVEVTVTYKPISVGSTTGVVNKSVKLALIIAKQCGTGGSVNCT